MYFFGANIQIFFYKLPLYVKYYSEMTKNRVLFLSTVVWRLVVADVLPRHAHAIEVVMHEGGTTVRCRYVGGEDVQMRRGGRVPEDELLTPVTEDISLEVGCRFRPVAGGRVPHFVQLESVA